MKAIDVSCWQTNIDYNAVKASGIDTVIIRAGFGRETTQKDSQFENHYKNAKAAGMNVGAYWYSYAESTSDAITEAKACIACLSGKTFDLPIYYDMEESWQIPFGSSTLTRMAENFCNTIESAGYCGGVYANAGWFTYYLNYSALASSYSIWLAQWQSSTYSYACDIWQYSEDGRVSGISDYVDMNEIINPNVIKSYSGGSEPKGGTVELTVKILAKSGYTNSGEQVKTIQRLLSSMGYKGSDGKALTIDGIFGANTEYAVKKYQAANGLTADGIVGNNTWKKITGAT